MSEMVAREMESAAAARALAESTSSMRRSGRLEPATVLLDTKPETWIALRSACFEQVQRPQLLGFTAQGSRLRVLTLKGEGGVRRGGEGVWEGEGPLYGWGTPPPPPRQAIRTSAGHERREAPAPLLDRTGSVSS